MNDPKRCVSYIYMTLAAICLLLVTLVADQKTSYLFGGDSVAAVGNTGRALADDSASVTFAVDTSGATANDTQSPTSNKTTVPYPGECVTCTDQEITDAYAKLPKEMSGTVTLSNLISKAASLKPDATRNNLAKCIPPDRSLIGVLECAYTDQEDSSVTVKNQIRELITEVVVDIGKKYGLTKEQSWCIFYGIISGKIKLKITSLTFTPGSFAVWKGKCGGGAYISYVIDKDDLPPVKSEPSSKANLLSVQSNIIAQGNSAGASPSWCPVLIPYANINMTHYDSEDDRFAVANSDVMDPSTTDIFYSDKVDWSQDMGEDILKDLSDKSISVETYDSRMNHPTKTCTTLSTFSDDGTLPDATSETCSDGSSTPPPSDGDMCETEARRPDVGAGSYTALLSDPYNTPYRKHTLSENALTSLLLDGDPSTSYLVPLQVKADNIVLSDINQDALEHTGRIPCRSITVDGVAANETGGEYCKLSVVVQGNQSVDITPTIPSSPYYQYSISSDPSKEITVTSSSPVSAPIQSVPSIAPHTAMVNIPSTLLSLTSGSKGVNVVTLQNYLIKLGYLPSDDNTGNYGPLTAKAVARYERDVVDQAASTLPLTPMITNSPSPTPTYYSWPSPTVSSMPTPTPSLRPSPTYSPSPTVSSAPAPTPTPTQKLTPTPIPSPSSKPNSTPSPTPTSTSSPTPAPVSWNGSNFTSAVLNAASLFGYFLGGR